MAGSGGRRRGDALGNGVRRGEGLRGEKSVAFSISGGTPGIRKKLSCDNIEHKGAFGSLAKVVFALPG